MIQEEVVLMTKVGLIPKKDVDLGTVDGDTFQFFLGLLGETDAWIWYQDTISMSKGLYSLLN